MIFLQLSIVLEFFDVSYFKLVPKGVSYSEAHGIQIMSNRNLAMILKHNSKISNIVSRGEIVF